MNENETVAEIVQNMRRKADQADFVCCGNIDASHVRYYANSILAAHRREIAKKDDERLTVVATYETVIAAKDKEIAKLRALVGELADELEKFHAWEECCALAEKAREVVK